jgi:hypothetical protein
MRPIHGILQVKSFLWREQKYFLHFYILYNNIYVSILKILISVLRNILLVRTIVDISYHARFTYTMCLVDIVIGAKVKVDRGVGDYQLFVAFDFTVIIYILIQEIIKLN